MKIKNALPFFAIAYYYFMSGVDYISIDYLTNTISPVVFVSLRFFICAIILFIIVLIKDGKLNIEKEDRFKVVLAGILGPAVYYPLEASGINYLSGAMASLILATLPLFGLVADKIFYKIKLTPLKITCVAMSIVGVVLIVVRGNGIYGSIEGILMMFGAVITWIFYMLLIIPLHEKYSTLTIITGIFCVGAFANIPMFLLSEPSQLLSISLNKWILIVITTLTIIGVGKYAYIYGLAKIPITIATIFANLLPLVSVTLSFLVLGTKLTAQQLIGGSIILLAVFIASGLFDSKDNKSL